MSIDTDETVTAPTYDHGEAPPTPPAEDGGGGERPQPVVCAFVVFQAPDGGWFASPDLTMVGAIEPARLAGNYDLTAGCSCVLRDVMAGTTAGEFVKLQAMMAERARANEENQRIVEMMNRSPNRAERRHP